MAFHSQSVNLLSKLACAPGHGVGDFPLAPIPTDREMEASVSVWECSSDVTGYTASSGNPAGMFATEVEFRYHQDGVDSYGVNKKDASSASGIQSNEKKRQKTKKTINMCETRANNRIKTRGVMHLA